MTDETAINAQLAGIELNDLWDVAARFAARLRAIGIANALPSSAPIRGSICERFNIVLERVISTVRALAMKPVILTACAAG